MGVKEGPFCRVCVGPTIAARNLAFGHVIDTSVVAPPFRYRRVGSPFRLFNVRED